MKFYLHKPRFFISIAISLLAILIISITCQSFLWTEKLIIGVNIYLWTYVILLMAMIKFSSVDKIKALAIKQDESAVFLFATSLLSATTAIGAIIFEISKAKEMHGIDKMIHLLIPTSTIISAWILIPAIFCVHYAHLYFSEKSDKKLLKFPEDISNPDYVDFLYFSVTIAAAAQTADISVTSKKGRKLVLLQSIIAFVFNTTILALGINVAASLLN